MNPLPLKFPYTALTATSGCTSYSIKDPQKWSPHLPPNHNHLFRLV